MSTSMARDYNLRWEKIPKLTIEHKRYPLEKGRIFKVKNKRGVYRVHSIHQNLTNPCQYEVHAWWRDREIFTGGLAHWRFVTPDQIKHVTGKVETK